jgi:anti-sigma B factor antagonist
MQLYVRNVKGVTLVDVSGRITLLDPPKQLKDRVASLVAAGDRNIVLCLDKLSFVDSSCIGELMASYIAAARAGGILKLANPPRRVQELLLVTRLADIVEWYDTEAAAIASFGSKLN